MIRAYDEEWFLSVNPGGDLRTHIRDTVLAGDGHQVRAAIVEYVMETNPAPQVLDLLNQLAANPALLGRVRVVTDRQWGNCTIRVTPGEAHVMVGGITLLDGTIDLTATLRYWALHAEAVLLQLLEEPEAEPRRPLLESLQWLLHWQFKRQFDQVLNQAQP